MSNQLNIYGKTDQQMLFDPNDFKCLDKCIEKYRIFLDNRVFHYDTSLHDRRFFLENILQFVRGDSPLIKEYPEFYNFCFRLCWQVNDKGRTLKYLYFNERIQKIYLHRSFIKWCNLVAIEISDLIKNNQ